MTTIEEPHETRARRIKAVRARIDELCALSNGRGLSAEESELEDVLCGAYAEMTRTSERLVPWNALEVGPVWYREVGNAGRSAWKHGSKIEGHLRGVLVLVNQYGGFVPHTECEFTYSERRPGEVADLVAELARVREENRGLRASLDDEVWIWQDDADDHPESLTCRVIMQPDVVRRLVKAEADLARIRAAVNA